MSQTILTSGLVLAFLVIAIGLALTLTAQAPTRRSPRRGAADAADATAVALGPIWYGGGGSDAGASCSSDGGGSAGCDGGGS
jgi:hypothetical protein